MRSTNTPLCSPSTTNLTTQQFSKQDHYDWGLRNIRSVLTAAGAMKRADLQANEEMIGKSLCALNYCLPSTNQL